MSIDKNDQLGGMINRDIPDPNGESTASSPEVPPITPEMEAAQNGLSRATGLPIDLREVGMGTYTPPVAAKVEKAAPIEPEETPFPNTALSGGMLTPDEIAQLGISQDQFQEIDPDKAFEEKQEKRFQQAEQAETKFYEDMATDLLKSEEERLQRLENTGALPEDDPVRKELLGPPKDQTVEVEIPDTVRAKDDRQLNSGYDVSDLMPSYDMEEEETPKAEDEEEDPDPTSDEFADYVLNLPVGEVIPAANPILTVLREPQVEEIVTTDWEKKKRSQPLGDQAFLNAITRFKKERFGKVTVPMVNSGFSIDVVGSGVVDIQNLYINVDQNTRYFDYQMEQMHKLIQNIVGTNPRVDPNVLRDKIHFADFEMLAFGHLCATFRTLEITGNCPECRMSFRATARPTELLMNMEELYERTRMIQSAPNIESLSLMTKYKKITTSGGFVVTMGHPSYANSMTIMNSFMEYSAKMTPMESRRFQGMLDLLYFIRGVVLPNGVKANTLYQMYLAIGMMDNSDLMLLRKELASMRKEILYPKFGIRETRCPNCGKIVKNIPYENIADMLFYHTQISIYQNQRKEKNTEIS